MITKTHVKISAISADPLGERATGFFIINKPTHITSHDVVAQVRRILGMKKVGHTGTLDPFATGVLLVAVGSATRLIQYTHDLQKTYQATITLGATSTTDDLTGIITPTPHGTSTGCNVGLISATLQKFTGHIEQIPPAYAAIKIKGKKLYEYAREGKEVDRKPRAVTIHSLELLNYTYPEIRIQATVSTGTYIRALARDIGANLKTGAYVSQLHRSAIGDFTDKKTIKLDTLTSENWSQHLHDAKELVAHMPSIILNKKNVAKLQQGREVTIDSQLTHNSANQNLVILDQQNKFIGIAEYTMSTNSLKAKTILPPPSDD